MAELANRAARPAALGARVASRSADGALDEFLGWIAEVGLEPYPAQEEALLELAAGRHVILNTPTGSGKSLVALFLHFLGLCSGQRSFYTSPIKALVSEKFFALCRDLGADAVGMMTGDATVNPQAKVICCTAEILAQMALRQGEQAPVDHVVMDEFHYFADRDRGMAWQVPLLTLPQVRFLLMSATLGDTTEFERRIAEGTGIPVALVRSTDRPVPLDFVYGEVPLHETIAELLDRGQAPIYLVNFTQRECAEQAQNLTSVPLVDRAGKDAIMAAIGGFSFHTPYGKEIKRFVHHGIGLHHAGLLPRYRLLTEKLAQQGLLRVISGTDTLGVGINVPIRTVLFTRLCKFDGEGTKILGVREFRQIAGRAGRKGFDVRGTVVVQAPEHVIENRRMEAKAAGDPKKLRKLVKKKPPERGFMPWDRGTFDRLIAGEPEALTSRFEITHGLMLDVLDREIAHGRRDGGYRKLVGLVRGSYERPAMRSRHLRHSAVLFRSLRQHGLIELVAVPWSRGPAVRVHAELQREFSLRQSLSLFLVDAAFMLDPASETHALDLLTLCEAVVEDPQVVLARQADEARGALIMELKAQGVEYEERMKRLEEVTHPKPNAEFIYQAFDVFRESHPWLRHDNVRPKSVARDLYERYASFDEYVRLYGLERSEGVLLRYLTDVYKTLVQAVPAQHKHGEVADVEAYLRTLIDEVDSSLVEEWEAMIAGSSEPEKRVAPVRRSLADDPVALRARIRAEVHALVRAFAHQDLEGAARALWPDPEAPWTEARLRTEIEPHVAAHGEIAFDHRARLSEHLRIEATGECSFTIVQVLCNREGATDGAIEAEVDVTPPCDEHQPILRLVRIAG